MKKVLAGLIATLVVLSVACGGGSGGGNPSQTALAASFTPDEPSPSSNTVAAAEDAVTGDLVTVAITLTDVSGVYGVDFDLDYDANAATFVGWAGGDLLTQGSHTPFYDVNEPIQGNLVVTATRQGNVSGASAVGTATVIDLTFRVDAPGSRDSCRCEVVTCRAARRSATTRTSSGTTS